MPRSVGLGLVLALAVSGASETLPAQTTGASTLSAQDVDTVARAAVQQFGVPGLAIAVVQDGRTVLARGYGVRRIGQPGAVDEHTLFYTASVTKAFTITAIGILADEGRLRPDDPVATHLPEFSLADRTLAGTLTVRDLMAHRTGLPRADLLMVSGLANAEIVRALARLAPQAPLRTRFSYQNQMYLVLGVLLERLSGMSWSRFVERRVLEPVGFVDGNAQGLGHWQERPAAFPHARLSSGVSAIDLVPREPYGAGGINASAVDMAAWLAFQLGDGTARGSRIVGANVLAAEHAPNTIVPVNASMPQAVLATYGLGWFIHDYDGRKIVEHGGNGEGWTSLVWMMPQRRLGIAVLTNLHNSTAPTALAYAIADRALGRPPHDWNTEYRALEARLGPPPLAAPAVPLSAMTPADAGIYEHPVYGRATVTAEDGRITFVYGTLAGVVQGTAVNWTRTDMAAVLGQGRLSRSQDAGRVRIVLEAGGERFEFARIQ